MWNVKLRRAVTEFGLIQSKVDPCLFTFTAPNECLFVAIYVDDITFTGTTNKMDEFEKALSNAFDIKHGGELKWILGMKVERDIENRKSVINQELYIRGVLEQYGMEDSNPTPIPMYPKPIPSKSMGPQNEIEKAEMAKFPYRNAIGSLSYAAVCTRPDISYAVSKLAQYCENPGIDHWKAIKQILRYLRETTTIGLEFNFSGDTSMTLRGYSDSDWASCIDTRRSTTGYVFMFNTSPISWNTKRQDTVAMSSTEAEYMALAASAQEAIFLKMITKDLNIRKMCVQIETEPKEHEQFPDTVRECTEILSDSTGAIQLAQNPTQHSRTKHIDIKHHFIRERIETGDLGVYHVPGRENPADMMTKALDWTLFTKHRAKTMGHRSLVEGAGPQDPTKNPRKRPRQTEKDTDESEE